MGVAHPKPPVYFLPLVTAVRISYAAYYDTDDRQTGPKASGRRIRHRSH